VPAEPGQTPDQLALIGPRGGLLPRPTARKGTARAGAASAPVAQVVLDSPLPRLDRTFDYAVPADLDAAVRFGVKVRLAFGRQRTEGWVVGRSEAPTHPGPLQWLEAVVAHEPQLTPQTLALCRAVADHYLGTLPDVLRLAIPPRHAAAASQPPVAVSIPLLPSATAEMLQPGPGRWVWTCPPGSDWAEHYASTLAAHAAAGGRGLAVVPDGRDLQRLAAALGRLLPSGAFATLTGQGSAAERYSGFRAALDAAVPLVVGTRSAAFAPLEAPDLLLLWDDGDDSHAERRAPYPHAREVLALRSTEQTTFVIGGYARSTVAQRWLEIGWARPLGPAAAAARRTAPKVLATDDPDGWATPQDRSARLPSQAGAAIRAGLDDGPVLVCVGRTGYLRRLSCQSCRAPANCGACGAALEITSGHASPTCTRCGRLAGDWQCSHCHGRTLRSVSIGSQRTAEELGRAFPGVPVVMSAGTRITDEVPDRPALVVATPGAEPFPAGGWAAVVVLDVAAALALPGLRSAEQAVRRWFNVGGQARPGAPMVLVAAPDLPGVQALTRWDPGWFAALELRQRTHAGMPPARKAVSLTGGRADLDDLVEAVGPLAAVLGPVPAGDGRERVLLTFPHRAAGAVAGQLRSRIVSRSAQRAQPVVVQVDPVDLT
jgi:primosomal protein N' (replication factor Y)